MKKKNRENQSGYNNIAAKVSRYLFEGVFLKYIYLFSVRNEKNK